MAAFDFPASPTNGQNYTANGVTFIWSSSAGAWLGGPVVDTNTFQPKDANLTALASLADSAAGYTYLDGAGGSSSKIAVSAAEFRAGTVDKLLENDEVWAAAVPVVVTYSSTITFDMATFINALVTVTGNLALGAPNNKIQGRSGNIRLNNTSGSVVNFTPDAVFLFPNTRPTTLPTGNSMLYYYIASDGNLYCSLATGYV